MLMALKYVIELQKTFQVQDSSLIQHTSSEIKIPVTFTLIRARTLGLLFIECTLVCRELWDVRTGLRGEEGLPSPPAADCPP